MLWIICFLLLMVAAVSQTVAQRGNILDEFYTYQASFFTTIDQRHYDQPSDFRSKRETNEFPNDRHQTDDRRLLFEAFGKSFDVDLKLNSQIFSDKFVVSFVNKIGRNIHRPLLEKCHYFGKLKNSPASNAVISFCSGSISGFLQDEGDTYYMMSNSSEPEKIIVTRHSDRIPVKQVCGVDLESTDFFNLQNLTSNTMFRTQNSKPGGRIKRSFSPPSSTDENSLFVELVMVGDVALFEKYKRDTNVVINYFIEITNIVNSIYSPLNIFVVLIGVEIWQEVDKIDMSGGADKVLDNFLKYRKTMSQYLPNDNAYLISPKDFEGNVVGKAYKGPMCSHDKSGGIAKDHSSSSSFVASTVAHEMGHNFGMDHDDDKCECSDKLCVMTAVISNQPPSPTHWSSCSREHLKEGLAKGAGICLKRVPTERELFHGPHCGNGFLENGEECDCGPERFCQNRCCNASTCTLSVSSTCGHGACCDMATCSLKAAATPCRPVSGECDLPEFCDGITRFCPNDVWMADGISCRGGEAYCFDGSCKTHNDQCRYLWGNSAASADGICFQTNTEGLKHGNCGKLHEADDASAVSSQYKACDVLDEKCGLLQCKSQDYRLNYEGSANERHILFDGRYIRCLTAYVDFGHNVPDPGMVPNGAKCGNGMVCLNQRCTNVSLLPNKCLEDCGITSVCNNVGRCQCKVPLGCFDTESARLRNAMLILFLFVLPLLGGFTCLFVYRHKIYKWVTSKQTLKGYGWKKSQSTTTLMQLPMSTQASTNTLWISEPLPIEKTSNTNLIVSAEQRIFHQNKPFTVERGIPPSLPQTQPKTTRNVSAAPPRPAVSSALTKHLEAVSRAEKLPQAVIKTVRRPAPPRPTAPESQSTWTVSDSASAHLQIPPTRSCTPPREPQGLQNSKTKPQLNDNNTGRTRTAQESHDHQGLLTEVNQVNPICKPLVFELTRKFDQQKNN